MGAGRYRTVSHVVQYRDPVGPVDRVCKVMCVDGADFTALNGNMWPGKICMPMNMYAPMYSLVATSMSDSNLTPPQHLSQPPNPPKSACQIHSAYSPAQTQPASLLL